jgi:hypothetical protein
MEHKTYSYKKMSHFRDLLTKTHNDADNILPYTDEQYNRDLETWFNDTKTLPNDKVNIINKYK